MALEFLFGKQLNQSNDALFSRIKSCIDKKEPVLYIVPEQFSFNADKTLLEMLGETYTHLTETVNFKRLALLVNKKYEPQTKDYIDEETKNLILYKIIKSNSSRLSTIKNRNSSPDSVLIFKNILSECKGHLIDHDTLENIKKNLEESSFLYKKINDLDFILTEYQKQISEKFKDFEDSFVSLAKHIEANNLYQNYHIFIDHFTNFSPAEYLVLSALMKQAKNVSVTLLTDDFSEKDSSDLFFPTFETHKKLSQIAKRLQIPVMQTNIDTTEESFFSALFDSEPQEANKHSYSLISAKNPKEEVRFVVNTIKKQVAQGASFSDFTVLTGDLSVYEDFIEEAFFSAKIPCFLDKKTPLTENPLSRIFLTLFAMVLSDYQKEAVLEYLKSLCAIFDIHNEVCIFEEVLQRFRLQKRDLSIAEKWNQKCEFFSQQKNFLSEHLTEIKQIYNTFLLPAIRAFSKKGNYRDSFIRYTKDIKLEEAVRAFLEKENSKQETITCYNIIMNAIKNIDILIVGEEITTSEYYHILKQSLELYESGEVPNTLDAVTVSDIERGRSLASPYVFILGMNENITPKASDNTSYLSDLERETILEITGIELPTAFKQNSNSNLSLYRAFLTAEKQLYLSKSETASDQTKIMPCYLWSKLEIFEIPTVFQEDFVNLHEYMEKAVIAYENPYKQKLQPRKMPTDFWQEKNKENFRPLFDEIREMKSHDYYETNKKLSKKMMESKYQKQLNASVSRLELYQKCGYAYFINYILKISERENVAYDFRKTGSIIHNLFEQFSKNLKQNQMTWETIDDDYIENQLNTSVPKEITRLFPELSLFNARTKYLIKKIKRMMKSAINHIREHFSQGEFLPFGYEIPLGENAIPPLTIKLEDGSIMQMFGIIDRCDTALQDDRLYIRIVDYKSSAKEFNFALIKEGIQLQLLTYLHTVVKNGQEYLDFSGEILPGAAFYTSFGDSLIPFSEKPGFDEVEAQIRKKFTLQGLVLNDDSLIRAIDKSLGEFPSYQSEICEIKTDKGGQYKMKNLLFLEEFNRLLTDCEETLANIGNTIMRGEISIKPYRYGKETGCDYCPYSAACMFDPKMHPYRNIGKLTKDDYFRKEGEEDGN